jgi:hypothetical protein
MFLISLNLQVLFSQNLPAEQKQENLTKFILLAETAKALEQNSHISIKKFPIMLFSQLGNRLRRRSIRCICCNMFRWNILTDKKNSRIKTQALMNTSNKPNNKLTSESKISFPQLTSEN